MLDDQSWCPRCGSLGAEPGLPHEDCWDGHADEASAAVILDRARAGSAMAMRMLGQTGDPRAADALRRAVSDGRLEVRRAGVVGLGWSGTPDDVDVVAPLLRSDERALREAAITTIAELGGAEAPDLLAALLDPDLDVEQVLVLQALAWLRDRRALAPLRRLLPRLLGVGHTNQLRGVGWALGRVGDQHDREAILNLTVDFARRVPAGTLEATPDRRRAQLAWTEFLAAARDFPNETESGRRVIEPWTEVLWPHLVSGEQPPARTARGPLTVARRHMLRIAVDVPDNGERPRPKFGGTPDWRTAPTWPVDELGRQLVFYGQLPLPGVEPRTAYIFIKDGGDSWRLLGPDNALVVQPGPPPRLPTVGRAHGPRLFDRVDEEPTRFRRRTRMASQVRYVELADGADCATWEWQEQAGYWRDDVLDWNKVGGTPLFLQGEEFPPGDGWTFGFQFSADRAGRELGDGAVCFGWVHRDGRGAFGWQCH